MEGDSERRKKLGEPWEEEQARRHGDVGVSQGELGRPGDTGRGQTGAAEGGWGDLKKLREARRQRDWWTLGDEKVRN